MRNRGTKPTRVGAQKAIKATKKRFANDTSHTPVSPDSVRRLHLQRGENSAGLNGIADLEDVVRSAHDLGQGRRRAAEQLRKVLPVRLQLATRDRSVNRGYEAGSRLIEAVLLEHINVLFYRQVTIGHPRAGDVADGPSELGEIERWAAKLVRRVSTFVAKECCRGCRREVLARGRRDPAVSSRARNLPTGEVFAQMVCNALPYTGHCAAE